MKLSDGVEWGLHCTVLLAALPPSATLPGKALAEFHGVSESYLVKHLKALVKGGILESIPGPRGGYRLARPPEETTVLDVVEAVEGSQPAFRCTEIRQRGPASLDPEAYRLPCPIDLTMLLAEKAWKDALRAQTLAQLAQLVAQGTDARAIPKVLAWLKENERSST